MRPPFAHLPAAWLAQTTQAQARQRSADTARAATTYVHTPSPVYSSADQPTDHPDPLPPHAAARFRAAAVAARRRYPAVVGDVLAEHLLFHADSGWAGDPGGKAGLLAAHLLDQAAP